MVQERTQAIHDWLETHQDEIRAGRIKVYAVDECHAKGGDICGYGWGNRQQRREIQMDNYRDSQTYFGALDCVNERVVLKTAKTANSDSTIEFVKYLKAQSDGAKVVLIWDGASYHRSQAFRDYLNEVNQEEDWSIHCLRFPPYAPEENPIENIWGQAKQILRQLHSRCRAFKVTKTLFELFINYRLFTMPNLNTYKAFSCIT